MKATVSRRHPVGRTAPAGPLQPVDQGHAPFASSVLLSLVLHGIVILWMLGSAWLLSRTQPYRLTPQTVYLAGDSPIIIDQVPGEGGGASGVKQESKAPGGTSKAAQVGTGAEPSVEKFAPPVEKPVPPPPKPVPEKALSAPPPRPVLEKAAPPPPKPVVEKPAPPTPAPKPVVEKAVPAPPKPPPEAMTLAQKQKETKPPPLPIPSTSTPTEAQQKVVKLRERQLEQETVEAKTTTEAQQKVAKLREQQAQQDVAEQRVASLRAEQAEKQSAQQRVAALRARVGSGGSGDGGGSSDTAGSSGSGPGSGSAGTGSGSGAPGGGRGTGTAGAGSVGTGGLSGIRLRAYQAELQAKITNAWNIPPQSKGLRADFFLSINRAGHIEQARLVRGSGNALFDESLQRAIKQAQPLPSLPEDYKADTLGVTLTFRDRS
jgi:colicin import membrane protein